MSSRRNWDSPNSSLDSKCALPPEPEPGGGGGAYCTRLRMRGRGSPNFDDLRKGLAFCLLCGEQ
jgi:hypothetical protein